MFRFRDYSIAKKLTWMNMLVSGAALSMACAAFVTYGLVVFREALVANLSIQAQVVGTNSISALLFNAGRKADLNARAAFLHLAGDAAVSMGVVLTGIAILLTRWTWLDPLVSVLIALVILAGTWGLLRESLDLALDAVPSAPLPRRT